MQGYPAHSNKSKRDKAIERQLLAGETSKEAATRTEAAEEGLVATPDQNKKIAPGHKSKSKAPSGDSPEARQASRPPKKSTAWVDQAYVHAQDLRNTYDALHLFHANKHALIQPRTHAFAHACVNACMYACYVV